MSHAALVLAHQEQLSRIAYAKPHAAVMRDYMLMAEADALAMAPRNPSAAMHHQKAADNIRDRLQLRVV